MGLQDVGGAVERDGAAGAERVRRADHGADIARILHPVDHQRAHRRIRGRRQVGQRVRRPPHHGEHTARCLGVGEVVEFAAWDHGGVDAAGGAELEQRLHGAVGSVIRGQQRLDLRARFQDVRDEAPPPRR